jgi:hypothetical protein
MIQFGKRQGLFAEIFASGFIGDGSGTEHLDGDFAIEVLVVGTIDRTHPAAADFLNDAVVGKLKSDEGVYGLSLVWHRKNSFPFTFCGES